MAASWLFQPSSDGTNTDFGAIRLVSLKDPDGMEGEVARWTDSKRVLGFEERKREAWQTNDGQSFRWNIANAG